MRTSLASPPWRNAASIAQASTRGDPCGLVGACPQVVQRRDGLIAAHAAHGAHRQAPTQGVRVQSRCLEQGFEIIRLNRVDGGGQGGASNALVRVRDELSSAAGRRSLAWRPGRPLPATRRWTPFRISRPASAAFSLPSSKRISVASAAASSPLSARSKSTSCSGAAQGRTAWSLATAASPFAERTSRPATASASFFTRARSKSPCSCSRFTSRLSADRSPCSAVSTTPLVAHLKSSAAVRPAARADESPQIPHDAARYIARFAHAVIFPNAHRRRRQHPRPRSAPRYRAGRRHRPGCLPGEPGLDHGELAGAFLRRFGNCRLATRPGGAVRGRRDPDVRRHGAGPYGQAAAGGRGRSGRHRGDRRQELGSARGSGGDRALGDRRRASAPHAPGRRRCSWSDDRVRIGFIFGTGLVARFFERYYESGAGGYAAAARIVARIFAGSFVADAYSRSVLEPLPCRLLVDGQVAGARSLQPGGELGGQGPRTPHVGDAPSRRRPAAPALGRLAVGDGRARATSAARACRQAALG